MHALSILHAIRDDYPSNFCKCKNCLQMGPVLFGSHEFLPVVCGFRDECGWVSSGATGQNHFGDASVKLLIGSLYS